MVAYFKVSSRLTVSQKSVIVWYTKFQFSSYLIANLYQFPSGSLFLSQFLSDSKPKTNSRMVYKIPSQFLFNSKSKPILVW